MHGTFNNKIFKKKTICIYVEYDRRKKMKKVGFLFRIALLLFTQHFLYKPMHLLKVYVGKLFVQQTTIVQSKQTLPNSIFLHYDRGTIACFILLDTSSNKRLKFFSCSLAQDPNVRSVLILSQENTAQKGQCSTNTTYTGCFTTLGHNCRR